MPMRARHAPQTSSLALRICRRGSLLIVGTLASVLPRPAVAGGDEPLWVVETVDGEPFTGRLTAIHGAGATLSFDVDGEVQSLAGAEVVSLRRAGDSSTTQQESSAAQLLMLSGGDWLYARVLQGGDEAVAVDSSRWGPLNVPWEAIRAIVLKLPRDPDRRHGLMRRLEDHVLPHDLVVMQNGDTLSGTLLEIDETAVLLESAGNELSAERPAVAAIAMNAELVEAPVPEGLHGVVLLADGSRLTVRPVSFSDGRFGLQTSFGEAVQLPLPDLQEMRLLGGNVVYLSDLQPESYEHTPYLRLHWPWMRDRSVSGRPMRLGGRDFAKGVAVHSRSQLTYDLSGQYRRFDATVGIDDETHGQGSVVFRVLVDGRETFVSPVMRGGAKPLRLESIDVAGAKKLALIVEFADRGDVQDHADWANARLAK